MSSLVMRSIDGNTVAGASEKAFVAVSGSGVASAFVSGAGAATVSGLKLMVGMVEVVCAFMAQNAAVKAAPAANSRNRVI